MKPAALLLDLDGTLLDTAPDLAHALEQLCHEHSVPCVEFALARAAVSHGGASLVELAFPNAPPERRQHLVQRFLDIYATSTARWTQPFPGFEVVFAAVATAGIPWGIVTNKPAWLTLPLLERQTWLLPPGCVVCGDTVARAKPHPMPLLHAAQLLQVPPGSCVYVGDAERDIAAGRAAGMVTLTALWGYLDRDDRPAEWGANQHLDSVQALAEWIKDANGV